MDARAAELPAPGLEPPPQPVFIRPAAAEAAGKRSRLWDDTKNLRAANISWPECARRLGAPMTTLWSLDRRMRQQGEAALADGRVRSGRRPALVLTAEERTALQSLYLRTNCTSASGSMRAACKVFALDPGTRDEVRSLILGNLERRRVPLICYRACQAVTRAHVHAYRQPRWSHEDFAGEAGGFAQDKIERRRVVEADDGTLNFGAWIPWSLGGDPCSDRYGVRLARWQFLPAMEAGWSQAYLGYALVCRPRGSYREEDVRALIHLIAGQWGLPDKFRFECGSWKANAVVDLLRGLGADLENVRQSNHKPFIEGGFNALWTYLSLADGQLGRYRGEMEKENDVYLKCRAGKADPRDHFPALAQCVSALDGALALRNSDRLDSVYGSWVPEVRLGEHAAERPWRRVPESLSYLFSPVIRDWTPRGGFVGGKVPMFDDWSAPYYFAEENLWRWNGIKLRCYFDPAAQDCAATIVALHDYQDFKAGDLICRAPLMGALPHYCRASMGWADDGQREIAWRKAAQQALRRELHALAAGGEARLVSALVRDGRGNQAEISGPVREGGPPIHNWQAEPGAAARGGAVSATVVSGRPSSIRGADLRRDCSPRFVRAPGRRIEYDADDLDAFGGAGSGGSLASQRDGISIDDLADF